MAKKRKPTPAPAEALTRVEYLGIRFDHKNRKSVGTQFAVLVPKSPDDPSMLLDAMYGAERASRWWDKRQEICLLVAYQQLQPKESEKRTFPVPAEWKDAYDGATNVMITFNSNGVRIDDSETINRTTDDQQHWKDADAEKEKPKKPARHPRTSRSASPSRKR